MSSRSTNSSGTPALGRRELLAYTAAFGASFVAAQGLADKADAADLWALLDLASRAGDNPIADRALERLCLDAGVAKR